MSNGTKPLTTEQLKGLAERVLGASVERISAPGGRDRQSLRLHLKDKSVIATRRATARRAEHEAAFMTALNRIGAPVPRVLGFEEEVLFQEDFGRDRLSGALYAAETEADREALARAAMEALEDVRDRVEGTPDLFNMLPALGDSESWRQEFASRALFLSRTLGIDAPAVDFDAVTTALEQKPLRFVRWDARTGNASVLSDGQIGWFDWEVFGRRAGVEDFAWFLADDFLMLHPAAAEGLLATFPRFEQEAVLRELGRCIVLITANRLRLLVARVSAEGWSDERAAIREDRVAAAPRAIHRIIAQGQHWAAKDPMLEGFCPWFEAAAEKLVDQHRARTVESV